jgi:exoribonuclease R
MSFKINISNRNYTSWVIEPEPSFDVQINPLMEKMFNNDTFTLNKQIIYSPIRSGNPIPAILILQGNKTFGRKNNKLLYKCVPNDIALPIFLVPYEMKNVGFSKVFQNMYVTISFQDWVDKHPIGVLQNVIGFVDDLNSFYEYQVCCKELNHSINKFQKDVSKVLKNNSHDIFFENIKKRFPSIENRTNEHWNIFSIDPKGSLDFDDAVSICDTNFNNDSVKQISIYISNVSIWIDILNLWGSFTRRVSTIYLPDKKRSMIPAALSEGICSLQQNVTRIALVMDIFVKENGTVVKVDFCNAFIKVFKNFCYDEPSLLKNEHYCKLLQTVKKLNPTSTITDSHELISVLMILMNYHCACELAKYRSKGIFRKTIPFESAVPDLKTFTGNYVEFSDSLEHVPLGFDIYIHITSPIRRIVDLLNSIVFQILVMKNQELSFHAMAFYDKWVIDLDYINSSIRKIRKVQSDCELLKLCITTPEILTTVFEGYLLEPIERKKEASHLLCYNVYLPKLKLFSHTYIPKDFIVTNNCLQKFQLFLFQDEERLQKKIRIQFISSS